MHHYHCGQCGYSEANADGSECDYCYQRVTLCNLTPHPIAIHGDGEPITLQPDGPAPRLRPIRTDLGKIAGIPIVRTTLGDVEGLPDPIPGVIRIVSALVAEHSSVAHRDDLAYPGEAIRDADGRIVGCRGLCAGPGLARRMEAGLLSGR